MRRMFCSGSYPWHVAIVAVGLAVGGCGGGGDEGVAGHSAAARLGGRGVTAQRASSLQSTAGPQGARSPFSGLSLKPDPAQEDAVRLAQQATFGPDSALIADIQSQGAAPWVAAQLALTGSVYTSGKGDAIHKNRSQTSFCDTDKEKGDLYCWRDWYSPDPLAWDFFRNAIEQPDQLRQRTAFALQQVFVVSGLSVYGTYGWRNYQNMLLDNAFGNYRELLHRVALSPLMGEYLNLVNNDRTLPNENFARELLQLFSLGTCRLRPDGRLEGDRCKPTYDNDMVRNYAYALTGWTFPKGGHTAWGCWPEGANCEYMGGDMVPAHAFRDPKRRQLLSGVQVPAHSTSQESLDKVLDSLMAHPNIAPFVAKRMIQHFVGSNPTPDYVQRVAQAFIAGSYTSGEIQFGTGVRGDMAATIAAVLLDEQARGSQWDAPNAGHLREPVLMMTGVLRALNGHTDGAPLGWWWGSSLRQMVFYPPSVFSFYPSDYPVAGTSLVGPEFGIHNANTALERLDFLTYLLDWDGSDADPSIPHSIPTRVDLTAFLPDADDPDTLVDGLSMLTLGRVLAPAPRADVLSAVKWWNRQTDAQHWRLERVRTAAYLVLGSPDYQVQP